MADELRFDGRVVLVTGAGGGLGKDYALAFASKGASVVVNDLGGDAKGGGKNSVAADKVVEEIRSRGGKAVADYNSVEDGEKVVQTALDAFGRIDVLVNNAGILRDRSFGRTSDLDWDLIQRVHLRGAFKVTRAAWPHMRKQNYGKIIMTSSHSGVLGNFGQANYSAAKMGLIGLSNTLSIEGAKYNVLCNAIVPIAASRLTKGLMPPDVFEALKPGYCTPFVVYLCHESCPETGGVFEMAAGWGAQLRWQESSGAMLRKGGVTVTPEMVRDNWDKITDWTGPVKPKVKGEHMTDLIAQLEESKVSSEGEAKANKVPEKHFSFEAKNVILYALGVGVTVQEDSSHLKFLYEGSDDFSTLPTFGVIPAQMALNSVVMSAVEQAGLPFNPAKLLHGEQYLELYKPLPTSGTLTSKGEVGDILDKGKGALVLVNVTSYDSSGEAVCFNQFSIYIGGAGGFGGKKRSEHAKPLVTMPTRAPDASVKEKTSCCQAAIYRLSGDSNPIHIDPDFAQMGGFSSPILHGLCSFGYAARQTIQTDMWRDGNRICLQCTAVESGQVVLSGAYVDLKDIDIAKKTMPSLQEVDALLSSQGKSGLKSEILFNEISKRVKDHPDLVKKVKGIFEWNVTKGGKTAGQWTVDLKSGAGSVSVGPCKKDKPDCTITVEDDDLASIATGKSNPQQLFMKGKLKVKGNIMLTTKLAQLFKDHAKM
ncbi:hypothetical protein ACROYT_G010524 [Oculina patagonica]